MKKILKKIAYKLILLVIANYVEVIIIWILQQKNVFQSLLIKKLKIAALTLQINLVLDVKKNFFWKTEIVFQLKLTYLVVKYMIQKIHVNNVIQI